MTLILNGKFGYVFLILWDTRSVTGSNLRSILLKTSVCDIVRLRPGDVKYCYRDVPREELYRVGFIKELVDIQNNQAEVAGFSDEEIGTILQYLCVS